MRYRPPGFSLIEVLVAFTVLTGVLVVTVPVLTGTMGESAARVEAAFAEDYAHSRLAAFGTTLPLAALAREGKTTRWRWRESVRALPAEQGFEITIDVYDASGRRRLARVVARR